jgi:hypothetical protein
VVIAHLDFGGAPKPIAVEFGAGGFPADRHGVFFETADCSGTPYLLLPNDVAMLQGDVIGGTGSGVEAGPGTFAFLPSTSSKLISVRAIRVSSDLADCVAPDVFTPPSGCCRARVLSDQIGIAATTVDLSSFTPPFYVDVP